MLFRILAITVCLCLIAPAGAARERRGQLARMESGTELNRSPEIPVSRDVANPQGLNPEEERTLSERAEEPGPEVAGGALTSQQLTYVVIALAAAVLVLILK